MYMGGLYLNLKQKLCRKKLFTDEHTKIDLESDFQPIDIIAVPHLVVTIRIPKISNFSHLYRYSIYVMYYIKHNFLLKLLHHYQGLSMKKLCFLKNLPLSLYSQDIFEVFG